MKPYDAFPTSTEVGVQVRPVTAATPEALTPPCTHRNVRRGRKARDAVLHLVSMRVPVVAHPRASISLPKDRWLSRSVRSACLLIDQSKPLVCNPKAELVDHFIRIRKFKSRRPLAALRQAPGSTLLMSTSGSCLTASLPPSQKGSQATQPIHEEIKLYIESLVSHGDPIPDRLARRSSREPRRRQR